MYSFFGGLIDICCFSFAFVLYSVWLDVGNEYIWINTTQWCGCEQGKEKEEYFDSNMAKRFWFFPIPHIYFSWKYSYQIHSACYMDTNWPWVTFLCVGENKVTYCTLHAWVQFVKFCFICKLCLKTKILESCMLRFVCQLSVQPFHYTEKIFRILLPKSLIFCNNRETWALDCS